MDHRYYIPFYISSLIFPSFTCEPFTQSLSEKNTEKIERMISTIKTKTDSTRDVSMDSNVSFPISSLGPGQILPKVSQQSLKCVGELRLAVSLEKSVLELKVISARTLVSESDPTPDTYVKCYLKDGDRLRHKKKTRVVRYSPEPQYNQVLKYSASDLFGRTILVTIWQKSVGFEHNQCIGGAELFFNTYKMKTPVESWYPLFPSQHVIPNSSDSP